MKELVSWLPAIVGMLGLIVPYLMYKHIKKKDSELDIEDDMNKIVGPLQVSVERLGTNLKRAEDQLRGAIKDTETRINESTQDTKEDFRYSLSETERRLTELVRHSESQLRELIGSHQRESP